MNKKSFKPDEREMNVFRKICTTMYIITIYALMGIVSYRQFVLGQPHQQWDDIAMLMTINVIVVIGALLYASGSISLKKIKLRNLIVGYIGFVTIGFTFTIIKYAFFDGTHIDLAFALDTLKIILLVSGILILVWIFLAYLGNRKIEKRIK